LKNGNKNFILGLSTGGRGVALITLSNNNLFTAVASISGDFDQTLMPNDKLMEGYYGPHEVNKERWLKIDNPVYMASQWNTPLYLSHGTGDKVVSVEQTKVFYNALRKQNVAPIVKLHLATDMGHDFKYWDSEVDSVLKFFKGFF
jgi:dipeptidyl aminopeptidase/acylaminoacyl peptidase